MKFFYRVISSVAVILIGIGVLLGGIGLLLGGRMGDLLMVPGFGHRLGFFTPSIWGNDTVEADYTGIRSLDFEFRTMDVVIKEGDGFSIRAERVNARRFITVQDGDEWKIRCDGDEKSGLNRINWGNKWEKKAPKVVITVPKGFTAEELKLEMGMGYLTAGGLSAKESEVYLGMGEINLANFSSGDCDLEVGMGNLTIQGKITGRGDLTCGMGSAELLLEGQESDYGFDATVGMGSVNIGPHTTEGFGGSMVLNSSAPNFFTVDCGMGSVDIRFSKER